MPLMGSKFAKLLLWPDSVRYPAAGELMSFPRSSLAEFKRQVRDRKERKGRKERGKYEREG